MRRRLSILMFLQYAPAGALLPLFTVRITDDLHFTPMERGWVCATQAVASILGPLLAGQVADRWWPAERCVTVLAFAAAVVAWLMAELTSPATMFVASLAFWITLSPAITLGTAITFTHLPSPDRDFGRVRMWGTVGWVTAGWLLGYWFLDPAWLCRLVGWFRPEQPRSELADIFRLSALLACVFGCYALTLPHTPPQRQAKHRAAPLAALRLLRTRAFLIYFICAFGVWLTMPFTSQLTPLLLEKLGVPKAQLGPTLTISQSTEIVSLGLLPLILLRLGLRGTMLLGLIAWFAALTMQTLGRPDWLVVGSIGLNGLCVCCFLVAGQVFTNSRARGDIRASAQALITVAAGLGMLAGNLLVGWVSEQAGQELGPTFAVAAAIALVLAVVFFLFFSDAGKAVTAEAANAALPSPPILEA